MGRYLTPSGGAGGSGTMRSLRNSITASNPALPVPAWAKFARITGVGGGGGGGNYIGPQEAYRGGGGGAGGLASGALLVVAGESTMSVTIGAGGAGAAASSGADGSAGTATVVVLGTKAITLGGGKGGGGSVLSDPPYFGAGGIAKRAGADVPDANYFIGYSALNITDRAIMHGLAPGAIGANNDTGCGGAESAYGRGGAKIGTMPAANEPGESAKGNGAGGAGGRGAGAGGNGSPGLLIVEFLEAV